MKVSYSLILVLLLLALSGISAKCTTSESDQTVHLYPKNGAVQFSQTFLLSVKSDEPFELYLDTLSRINLDSLESELNSREKKLTFWINTYNTLVQAKAREDSSSFKNRDRFFKKTDLMIGGQPLSLDNIEHDLLRGQNSKNWNEFVSRFHVEELDNRIHFALNCGAAACPPIAFYSAEKIDEQLDLAEAVFIESSSSFDQSTGELTTSKILDWYKDDFGGEEGIIDLMRKHHIIDQQEVPKINYVPYDWTLDLNNY